jgi:hypothetical protein
LKAVEQKLRPQEPRFRSITRHRPPLSAPPPPVSRRWTVTVANALRDLLELAKKAGIDPAHPAMKAAGSELEKLATYIARQASEER